MEAIRAQLLENQLNALDRLFDFKIKVIDLHALTHATAQALVGDPMYSCFDDAARALAAIIGQGLSDDDERERALVETDALRRKLADELPFP